MKRTLDYGRNATHLGADGLIGIHWRTLAHAPEFSSLAIFPWKLASDLPLAEREPCGLYLFL